MKLAIIEDSTNYRKSLVASLTAFEDIEIIHTLCNALYISDHFDRELPDITLLDINMPGLSGLDAIKEISQKYSTVQCVMLTINSDLDTVINCMQFGAKGYLVKNKDNINKIVDSIRTLHSGNYNEEFPLNGTLAHQVLLHFVKKERTISSKLNDFRLTPRQKEVLKLLYDGKSYKQIADICSISVDTLNSHIKAIYPKLKIRSRGEIKGVLE